MVEKNSFPWPKLRRGVGVENVDGSQFLNGCDCSYVVLQGGRSRVVLCGGRFRVCPVLGDQNK